MLGCINPEAFNYQSYANTDDGSCLDVVYGCTDILAANFDSLATTDNDSCYAYIGGCTDTLAINYEEYANQTMAHVFLIMRDVQNRARLI